MHVNEELDYGINRAVLVTGGCGYIGTTLVPQLLARGYDVRVLDILWFGNKLPEECARSPRLTVVQGDICDERALRSALDGVGSVIHLAAVANDPSADLDPAVTRSINYDAVVRLVDLAEQAGVRRLVNASSATVYGVRPEPNVTEDLPHDPISLYGEYKSKTDRLIASRATGTFETVSIRSATVCGWSPRMRLDLTVNLLTAAAVSTGKIVVHGGGQIRPNVTVRDLARAYIVALEAPARIVNGKAYNIAAQNASVREIAQTVCRVLDRDVRITVEPVFDARSYRLSADLVERELAFRAQDTIEDAIRDVAAAFDSGLITDAGAAIYRNLAQMQLVATQ